MNNDGTNGQDDVWWRDAGTGWIQNRLTTCFVLANTGSDCGRVVEQINKQGPAFWAPIRIELEGLAYACGFKQVLELVGQIDDDRTGAIVLTALFAGCSETDLNRGWARLDHSRNVSILRDLMEPEVTEPQVLQALIQTLDLTLETVAVRAAQADRPDLIRFALAARSALQGVS